MEQFNPVQTDTKTCDKHGEFVTKFTMVGDRRIMLGACPECARIDRIAEDERRRADDARREQSRLEARLARAGIPLRFRSRRSIPSTSKRGQRKVLATADISDELGPALRSRDYGGVFRPARDGQPPCNRDRAGVDGKGRDVLHGLWTQSALCDTWRKGSEKSGSKCWKCSAVSAC
jgi:hypothetical protein